VRAAVSSILALAALAIAGCGSSTDQQQAGQRQAQPARADAATPAADGAQTLHAHPQAVQPVAGAASSSGASAGPSSPSSVSVGPSSGRVAQPASDAAIRQELAASGLSANADQATLTPDGLAIPPVNAPAAVQAVITAGNEIAHLPYRFGGGHGTFEDSAYDCSGSLSFVFAAAGLLGTTVTSGQLESWGRAGKGRWITVFAAAGHTFMYVAGLRFDTVALAETGSRWSNRSADESNLQSFVVRHPPGL
jgi:cell wall-associated NlpC family hydrolase